MYPMYMYVGRLSIEERISRTNSILPTVILRPSIKIPYAKPLSVATVPQGATAFPSAELTERLLRPPLAMRGLARTAVERGTYHAHSNK